MKTYINKHLLSTRDMMIDETKFPIFKEKKSGKVAK